MKPIFRKGFFIILTGSLFLLPSCEKNKTDDQPGDPVDIITEVYQKEVIDSVNKLSFDLLKPILENSKGTENIMISPFSITSALSMTLNGSAGETFEAMRKALGLENKTLQQINATYLKLMTEMVPVDKRVVFDIANSVWVEKRLVVKEPFMNDLQTWYKAEAREIDVTNPGSVDIVNGWIEEKTHDKIKDMLDYLDPDLAMLLINAVYFNGKWRYQFDKADTREEAFFVTPSDSKTVPTMHQKENLKYTKTSDATIVELPYGQGNFAMTIILPDENISTEEIAMTLSASKWNEYMEQLGDHPTEVELSMPRFKYEYKRLLNDDLIALGMGIAFTPGADFSNISDAGLMINRVIHQTYIETNEEGTEAAAATVVEMTLTSMPVTTRIDINRPFLYFIRETSTGTILFAGRVSDPSLN